MITEENDYAMNENSDSSSEADLATDSAGESPAEQESSENTKRSKSQREKELEAYEKTKQKENDGRMETARKTIYGEKVQVQKVYTAEQPAGAFGPHQEIKHFRSGNTRRDLERLLRLNAKRTSRDSQLHFLKRVEEFNEEGKIKSVFKLNGWKEFKAGVLKRGSSAQFNKFRKKVMEKEGVDPRREFGKLQLKKFIGAMEGKDEGGHKMQDRSELMNNRGREAGHGSGIITH